MVASAVGAAPSGAFSLEVRKSPTPPMLIRFAKYSFEDLILWRLHINMGFIQFSVKTQKLTHPLVRELGSLTPDMSDLSRQYSTRKMDGFLPKISMEF